jgi:serine/threonine protein phosphatase PrpC
LPREILTSSDDQAYVLFVADGMGGHQFGEIASSLALRTSWDLGGTEIKWALKMNEREAEERIVPFPPSTSPEPTERDLSPRCCTRF